MGDLVIADLEAGMADTGWKANRYYDCYYADFTEESGSVSFIYYICPDYEKMGVEISEAVVFQCTVGNVDGELKGKEFPIYSMTKEKYQKARVVTLIIDGETVAFLGKGI